jgi:hypothetical protein
MKALALTSILASMSEPDALLADIERLLRRARGGDDPEQLARTLTDGYARALSLEAERSRLQRRIGHVTATLDRADSAAAAVELSTLAERMREHDARLSLLRGKLERLRARHSLAVRAPVG